MQNQIQKQSIGIIGAGISGLSAGYFLKKSNPQLEVTIFQSTAKVGGRANTFIKSLETNNSQQTDLIFDHGANYFTVDSPQHEEFLNQNIFSNPKFKENLVDIPRHIYLLDKQNTITKSEKVSKKYTYTTGLRTLSQIFESECNCNFQLNKKVLSVKKLNENWQVNCQDQSSEQKTSHSYNFDKILFAVHPVSLARILSKSEPQELFNQHVESLKQVSHRAIANISLGFDISKYQKYPLTDFFALVNTDRENDVSWLCLENDKPGHIQNPKEYLGITIQMSDEWSRQTWEMSKDETIAIVKQKVNKILTEQCNHQFVDQLLPQILSENHVFQLVKKWEYALHNNTPSNLELFTKPDQSVYKGLYFCGDYLFDKARVTNAMISGFQASSQILNNGIQQKI